MTKETALALFEKLVAEDFPHQNDMAPAEDWRDENTPPTEDLAMFAVRLDAPLDKTDTRPEDGYRVRVRINPIVRGALALDALSHLADDALAECTIQNDGVEMV
jgi:hypothetical protein